MQINPVADSQLCWQAAGDGAPIVLEACDPDVRNQQWSLTPDGVLMNGIGYCLEAPPGQPQGTLLYIDFAGQCDGSRGQVWTYTGSTGHLSSSGTGTCAAPGGPIAAGTQVVQAACRPHSPRWSIGYSAVTLAAGPGSHSARGSYSASVTVANAASAQTAYGVAMTFGLPRGLAATAIHAAGGASGFRCDIKALTCTGTLPPGTSGRIDISGRLPRDAAPGASYTVSARAAVRDTSQLSGTVPTTALVKVSFGAPAPTPATGGGVRPLSVPVLVLIVGILLLSGSMLVGIAARRRPARLHAYARPHAYARLRAYARFRAFRPHAYARLRAYARLHAYARPRAYEGRRRRSGREPLAEPQHLAPPAGTTPAADDLPAWFSAAGQGAAAHTDRYAGCVPGVPRRPGAMGA